MVISTSVDYTMSVRCYFKCRAISSLYNILALDASIDLTQLAADIAIDFGGIAAAKQGFVDVTKQQGFIAATK